MKFRKIGFFKVLLAIPIAQYTLRLQTNDDKDEKMESDQPHFNEINRWHCHN